MVACNEEYAIGEFEADSSLMPEARTDAPSAPPGLVIVSSCSQVEISWDSIPRTTNYDIYIGETPLVQGLTETKYVYVPDNNDLNDYRIFANNPNGASEYSGGTGRLLGTPSTVSGLTASDEEFQAKIVVNWDVAEHADFYRIEVGGEVIADQLTDTIYTDVDVTQEPKTYDVIAYSTCGEAAPATVTGKIVQGSAPETPANFLASDGTDAFAVEFSWDAVEGVQFYKILVGGEIIADEITETTYMLTEATVEPQEYSIVAYNPFGESAPATDQGNLAFNFSVEAGFEAGEVGTGYGTLAIEETDVYEGSKAVRIGPGGSAKEVMLDLEPGKTYAVTYAIKHVDGTVGAAPGWWKGMNMIITSPKINNGADKKNQRTRLGVTDASNATTWTEISFTLEVPAPGHAWWTETPGATEEVKAGLWVHGEAGVYLVDKIGVIEIK